MLKHTILVLCLLLLPGLLLAQDRDRTDVDYGVHPSDFQHTGRSGWQFLKVPTNARIAGMGGITTSIGRGDAFSAFGNPSLITDVQNLEVGITRMNWLVDIAYNSASIVKNFGALGAFGINLIYLDYGNMVRTENEEILDNFGNSTGMSRQVLDGLGTFGARDYAVGLSYGRRVSDRFQVGGTAKWVNTEIDDASTGQWSVDVGTMFYTGFRSLRVAMSGNNFGPDAEFVSYDERLGIPAVQMKMPMVFILGVGYDLIEESSDSPHLWSLGMEFTHPNDGPEKIHLGTEYSFMNLVRLRGGYRFNYDEENLTLGAGLNMKTSMIGLKADYAYVAFGRFNSVHVFSIAIGL